MNLEPPPDPHIFNRHQADGTFRPLDEYFTPPPAPTLQSFTDWLATEEGREVSFVSNPRRKLEIAYNAGQSSVLTVHAAAERAAIDDALELANRLTQHGE